MSTPGDAVLGSYTNAAQFQVTDGQLIQNPQGTKLYAQVAQPASGDVKLKVTWADTPATFGTFKWTGDTLEWSEPTVKRSQNNVSYIFSFIFASILLAPGTHCWIGMAYLSRFHRP